MVCSAFQNTNLTQYGYSCCCNSSTRFSSPLVFSARACLGESCGWTNFSPLVTTMLSFSFVFASPYYFSAQVPPSLFQVMHLLLKQIIWKKSSHSKKTIAAATWPCQQATAFRKGKSYGKQEKKHQQERTSYNVVIPAIWPCHSLKRENRMENRKRDTSKKELATT